MTTVSAEDRAEAASCGRSTAGAAASMRLERLAVWLGAALVVVLFCLPLYRGLGNTDYQNDEAGHAFSVDVMLQDGDWLTPKSLPGSTPFLEKPPLKFWIVAAPIRIGLLRNDEFGQRFWDALFGGAAFLYVFFIGVRLGGPVCGLVSVLLLFVHRPLLFEHGLRGNNMESMLVLAYSAGMYHFLTWRRGDGARRRHLHLAAIAVYFTAAFMCKFVAALFLPAILAGVVLSRREDRRRLREDRVACVAAAALAAVLIVPWFLYQFCHSGRAVWDTMFGFHVVTRLTHFVDPAHLQPWHYYVTALLGELQLVHVAVVVLAGLALIAIRTARTGWPEGLAVLLWILLPLGVMSCATSKIYHYTYPFLPPVALAGGYFAAVLVTVILAWLAPAMTRLDSTVGERLRRLAQARTQRILLVLAGGALAVLAATMMFGAVRIEVRGAVLLRNVSLVRPALLALVAMTLAGRLATACRVGVPLLALWLMLPLVAYRGTLYEETVQRHPLKSARACLQQVVSDRKPGVLLDGPWQHPFFYYLRGLGPFDHAPDGPDASIYEALFAPVRLRPVLLSRDRLAGFRRTMRDAAPALASIVARRSGTERSVLEAATAVMPLTGINVVPYTLLLSGPYSACSAEPLRVRATVSSVR